MAKLRLINNRVEDYTIVLSTRDKRHLGQIYGVKGVVSSCKMNAANEISFSVYKENIIKITDNDKRTYEEIEAFREKLWNDIVNFKLIWIKELNEYYEIHVSLDDSTDTYKTITATSLCEAELSQTNLYSVEINTDADIERDNYVATTFYNKDNPKASLLHRILEKVPHYSIKHVDASLCNIQRTFSIDGTAIYDFLIGECSEQFDCLFQFDTTDRSISVYDLLTVCEDCGERGEYIDKCPKCGSTNLKYYGEDTTIYIDKNNLTDAIHYEESPDNVKNCFKLEAGDDVITAAVIGLNPNGSDYIYYNTEEQLNDMPEELVKKLEEYDNEYNKYIDEYETLLEETYGLIDDILYYESSMMPTIEQAEVTAQTEVAKLTKVNLSPVSISSVTENTSVATINSALKNYARVYVKTGYVKLEIVDGATYSYIGEYEGADGSTCHKGTWKGQFKVTNYSDKEDVAFSSTLSIEVNDDWHNFMQQKIEKELASEDDENSIFDVLGIEELDDFKEALTYYSLARLTSFYDAIQGALDVLVQMDQASEGAELYDALYLPYYNKLQACQAELDVRQAKIDELELELQEKQERQQEIQKELDFKKYLGDYYPIFCAYRREDTYSNSNYVSDGLDNAGVIKKAKEFWEVAKKELEKASSKQITISSTLYNLLTIKEFEPILDYFELGNWLRIRVDGVLYRLRLIDYEINFDSLQTINVTFSTITKIKDFVSDVESVISSAQSMSKSYSTVMKQAGQGSEASSALQSVVQNGLNAGLVQIKNNDDEDVILDKHGILCRSKDDITGEYDPKQLKLTHNVIAFTKDNWNNVESVIGEHSYLSYDTENNKWIRANDYGVTTRFVTAGIIYGENEIVGGLICSRNYSNGATVDENGNNLKQAGSMINLDTGEFSFGGGALRFENGKVLISSPDIPTSETITEITDDRISTAEIIATNLTVKAANIDGEITAKQINTTGLIAENISGTTIKGKTIDGGYLLIGEKSGTYAEITSTGILNCNGANFKGKITGSTITGSSLISNNETTLYSTEITDGSISIYGSKNNTSIRTGFISSFKNSSEESDYDGLAISAGKEADAILLAIESNSGKLEIGYYLNNGCNPSGYVEKHVFYGDERHTSGQVYFGTSSRQLQIYDNGSYISLYNPNGNGYFNSITTSGAVYAENLYVDGTKSRLATTESYNKRLLYCYEMSSPMFGDLGEGIIDDTGKCYVFLDDIFSETIDMNCAYQVFLQPYGEGECYVEERTQSYFIVKGTKNLCFGWEVKAVQNNYDTVRLEELDYIDISKDYANDTYDYLTEFLEE